jgi:hypothetical protein
VGDWYTIGLCAGLGVAVGVLLAAVLTGRRELAALAVLAAGAIGAVIGLLVDDWAQLAGGAAGGVLGAIGAATVVSGAARRGGTRGGLALLVAGGALVLAGLAFVPVVGYLEAVILPALAVRLRGKAGERYAGLRTLAK